MAAETADRDADAAKKAAAKKEAEEAAAKKEAAAKEEAEERAKEAAAAAVDNSRQIQSVDERVAYLEAHGVFPFASLRVAPRRSCVLLRVNSAWSLNLDSSALRILWDTHTIVSLA